MCRHGFTSPSAVHGAGPGTGAAEKHAGTGALALRVRARVQHGVLGTARTQDIFVLLRSSPSLLSLWPTGLAHNFFPHSVPSPLCPNLGLEW